MRSYSRAKHFVHQVRIVQGTELLAVDDAFFSPSDSFRLFPGRETFFKISIRLFPRVLRRTI